MEYFAVCAADSVGSRDRVVVNFLLEFFVGLIAKALEEECSEVSPLSLGGSRLVFRGVVTLVRAAVTWGVEFIEYNFCSCWVGPWGSV